MSSASPETQTKSDLPDPIMIEIKQVANELVEVFEEICTSLSGGEHRTGKLARAFGVNPSVASKLLTSIHAGEPAIVLATIPGPQALKSMIGHAKPPSDLVQRGHAAVDRYESLITDRFASRDDLVAFVSTSNNEVRRQLEHSSKRSAYNAFRNLRGISAAAQTGAALLAPTPGDPTTLDVVYVTTLWSTKMRWPGVSLNYSFRMYFNRQDTTPTTSIADEVVEDPRDFVVTDWTTLSIERFECAHTTPPGGFLLAIQPEEALQPFDITMAHRLSGVIPADPRKANRTTGQGVTIEWPSKLAINDIVLFDHALEGYTATPSVHLLGAAGHVNPNDPLRHADLLAIDETLETLGPGYNALSLRESPTYPKLLREMAQRAGFHGEPTNTWRVRSVYPVVGSQISIDCA